MYASDDDNTEEGHNFCSFFDVNSATFKGAFLLKDLSIAAGRRSPQAHRYKYTHSSLQPGRLRPGYTIPTAEEPGSWTD